MTENRATTKQDQTSTATQAVVLESAICADGKRVHIAGVCGDETTEKSNAFNYTGREFHSDRLSNSTAPSCHNKFKTIHDTGFAAWFWSRVAVGNPNECWPWLGSKNGDGYGQTEVGGRYWTTRRLAFALANGHEAKGMLVCQHCGNRSCNNPAHLYEVRA